MDNQYCINRPNDRLSMISYQIHDIFIIERLNEVKSGQGKIFRINKYTALIGMFETLCIILRSFGTTQSYSNEMCTLGIPSGLETDVRGYILSHRCMFTQVNLDLW